MESLFGVTAVAAPVAISNLVFITSAVRTRAASPVLRQLGAHLAGAFGVLGRRFRA